MSIIDIITLVIATLGFILSVCQWIYVLYSKRTNFSLSIERFEWYRHPEYNRAIFTLMIWNNSSSPLTITRMCINEVKCLISHQWIGERYYPNNPETDIPCTERKLSPDFHIFISPHGGGLFSIVFDFKSASKIPKRSISIDVQTSNSKKRFHVCCPRVNNYQLYL